MIKYFRTKKGDRNAADKHNARVNRLWKILDQDRIAKEANHK